MQFHVRTHQPSSPRKCSICHLNVVWAPEYCPQMRPCRFQPKRSVARLLLSRSGSKFDGRIKAGRQRFARLKNTKQLPMRLNCFWYSCGLRWLDAWHLKWGRYAQYDNTWTLVLIASYLIRILANIKGYQNWEKWLLVFGENNGILMQAWVFKLQRHALTQYDWLR